MNDIVIETDNLCRWFGLQQALDGVSLSVAERFGHMLAGHSMASSLTEPLLKLGQHVGRNQPMRCVTTTRRLTIMRQHCDRSFIRFAPTVLSMINS